MTSISFCRWVNEQLLPNSVLEPGFPRHIGVETARKWLHELGFEVLDKKKGVYIDGHEREDVVKHRQKFLRQLVAVASSQKMMHLLKKLRMPSPRTLNHLHLNAEQKTSLFFTMSPPLMPMMMSLYSGERQRASLSGQRVEVLV